MTNKSLYERLGGYDGINAFVEELLSRTQKCEHLGRFWLNRGDDGIAREKQLLKDYLCANAGGPLVYTGRDMLLAHKGMKISEVDWQAFLSHAGATLEVLQVPEQECADVVAFALSLKDDIVEA